MTSYIIGQILGILASVCCLIGPFLKKWMMLIANITATTLIILNFLLIGQIGSVIFLNLVAILQNIIMFYHVKKETPVSLAEKLIFLFLYLGFGIMGMVTAPGFVWEINAKNMLELMPLFGALFLMISVFIRDEQGTRIAVLCNGIVFFIYEIIIQTTAALSHAISIVICIIAIYKYRKKTPVLEKQR